MEEQNFHSALTTLRLSRLLRCAIHLPFSFRQLSWRHFWTVEYACICSIVDAHAFA
jgi:hypothetical protein